MDKKLGLCLLIFLVFSVASLFMPFFSSDEYGYMASGKEILEGKFAEVGDVTRFPLFPFVLSIVYSLFGYSELVTKLLLLIIGCLSIFVFYNFLAKPALGNEKAFIATLLFASNPLFLYVSTRVLTESLFIFFLVIFAVLLHKAPFERMYAFLLGVAMGLLFLDRYIGLVSILVSAVYFMWLYWSDKAPKDWRLDKLGIGLIVFGLSPVVFSQLAFGEPWRVVSSFLSFFSQQSGGLNEVAVFSLPDKIPFYLPFLFILLVFASPFLWKALMNYKQLFKNNLLVLSGITIVGFWLALEVYGFFNVALLRYIVPFVPFLALFAGSANLPFKFRKFEINSKLVFFAVVLNLILAASVFVFFASYPKYVGYREAGQWATENCTSINSNIQKIVKHYSGFDNSLDGECTVVSRYDGALSPLPGQALVFESNGVKVFK